MDLDWHLELGEGNEPLRALPLRHRLQHLHRGIASLHTYTYRTCHIRTYIYVQDDVSYVHTGGIQYIFLDTPVLIQDAPPDVTCCWRSSIIDVGRAQYKRLDTPVLI